YTIAEKKAIRIINTDKQLNGKNIDYIAEDNNGNIWIIYSNGFLALLDPNSMSPVLQSTVLPAILKSEKLRLSIFADRLQNLWIYSREEPLGIFKLVPSTQAVNHITKSLGPAKLN